MKALNAHNLLCTSIARGVLHFEKRRQALRRKERTLATSKRAQQCLSDVRVLQGLAKQCGDDELHAALDVAWRCLRTIARRNSATQSATVRNLRSEVRVDASRLISLYLRESRKLRAHGGEWVDARLVVMPATGHALDAARASASFDTLDGIVCEHGGKLREIAVKADRGEPARVQGWVANVDVDTLAALCEGVMCGEIREDTLSLNRSSFLLPALTGDGAASGAYVLEVPMATVMDTMRPPGRPNAAPAAPAIARAAVHHMLCPDGRRHLLMRRVVAGHEPRAVTLAEHARERVMRECTPGRLMQFSPSELAPMASRPVPMMPEHSPS